MLETLNLSLTSTGPEAPPSLIRCSLIIILSITAPTSGMNQTNRPVCKSNSNQMQSDSKINLQLVSHVYQLLRTQTVSCALFCFRFPKIRLFVQTSASFVQSQRCWLHQIGKRHCQISGENESSAHCLQ